ncbi:UNVERIFIED_CONTAM: hypothetical protein FKN15_025849 [Acipenser sinensis]
MDLLEMIEQITRNAVAQREQLERWEREMGLAPVKKREPTELELLLQEWEQASGAPQPPEPEGEEPPLPEPREEELLLPEPRGEELPEPRGEELPLPEPRGEELPLPEPREEVTSVPPPQPRPPPLRSSPASLRPVPHPLLLDTLSAWERLEKAEHERGVALRTELIRQEKLELLAQRFDHKVTMREAWLNENQRLVSQDNFGYNLPAVEAAMKKHEAIEVDISSYEERIAVVVELSAEMESESYYDVQRIAAQKDNILRQWSLLKELVTGRRARLERNLTLQNTFQEMVYMIDWMEEMQVLLLSKDFGKHLLEVDDLLQKHGLLEADISVQAERVKTLNAAALKFTSMEGYQPCDHQVICNRVNHVSTCLEELKQLAGKRRSELEESRQLWAFFQEMEESEAWIQEKTAILATQTFGKNLSSILKLLNKHKTLAGELLGRRSLLQQTIKKGKQILTQKCFRMGHIQEKIMEVKAQWKKLEDHAGLRLHKLQEALSFFQFNAETDDLLAWLQDTYRLVSSEDFGHDEYSTQSLMKKHKGVAEEIEKHRIYVVSLRKHKVSLSAQYRDLDEVQNRMAEVEQLYTEVTEVTALRQQWLHDAVAVYRMFSEVNACEVWIDEKEQWLNKMEIPEKLEDVEVVAHRFESLDQEMNSLMGRILDVNQIVQQLLDGGHPSSAEVRGCQDHLNGRWNRIVELVEQKKDHLNSVVRIQNFLLECTEMQSQISKKRKAIETTQYAGTDLGGVLALQRKLSTMEGALAILEPKLISLQQEAEELAATHPSQAMEILVQFEQISVEWDELKRTLQGCEDSLTVASRLQQFIQDLDNFLTWLVRTQTAVASEELPNNLEEAERLINQHATLKEEIGRYEEDYNQIQAVNKLLAVEEAELPYISLQQWLQKLDVGWNKLLEMWESRREVLVQSHIFHLFLRDVKQAESFLNNQTTLLDVAPWSCRWNRIVELVEQKKDHLNSVVRIQNFLLECTEMQSQISKKRKAIETTQLFVIVHNLALLTNLNKNSGALAILEPKLISLQQEAEELAATHPSQAMEILVQFEQISVEWDELKRTLQGCEDSLTVASRLQQFIQDLENFLTWLVRTQTAVASEELPNNLEEAERLINQHAALKEEIGCYEEDYNQIQEVNKLLALEEAELPYISLQQWLQKLDVGWNKLLEMWESRREVLVQSHIFHLFLRDVKQAESFLNNQESALAHVELPTTVETVEATIKKHRDFTTTMDLNLQKIKAVMEAGESLVGQGSIYSERIKERIEIIRTRSKKNRSSAEEWLQKLLDQWELQRFLQDCHELDDWVTEKMLMARDTSRDEAHKLHKKWLKHQAFMAELAQNKDWLEKIEKEGQQLIQEKPELGSIVRKKLGEIRQCWLELESTTQAKARQLFEANKADVLVQSYTELDQQLLQLEGKLGQADEGRDLTSVNKQLKQLQTMEAQMEDWYKEVGELQVQATSIPQQGAIKDSVNQKQNVVETRIVRLIEPLKERRRILLASKEVHQVSRDLEDEISLQRELQGHRGRVDDVLDRAGLIASIRSPEADCVRSSLDCLQQLWDTLRSETEQRQITLDGMYQAKQYYFDVAEVETWLSEQELHMMTEEKGKDEASTLQLLKKHLALEQTIEDYAETIGLLSQQSRSLLELGHPDSEQISKRQFQIDRLYVSLKDLVEERKGKLEQQYWLYQLNREVDELEQWIAEKEVVFGSPELGQDSEHVTLLQEKFTEFASETGSLGQERVSAVNQMADELIDYGHADAATIAEWKDGVNEAWADLQELMETRAQMLAASHQLHKFFDDCRVVLSQIEDKQMRLPEVRARQGGSANTSSLQRLMHSFERDIQQLVTQVRQLQESAAQLRTVYAGEKAEAIAGREQEVMQAWKELLTSCEECRVQITTATDKLRFFGIVRDLVSWMDSVICQIGVGEKPRDISSVKVLMNYHQGLKNEIEARNKNVMQCVEMGKMLLAARNPAAEEIKEKMEKVIAKQKELLEKWDKHWEWLQHMLEVHQFAQEAVVADAWLATQEPIIKSQELGSSMDEVEQLIRRHEAFRKAAATWEERFSSLRRLTSLEKLKAEQSKLPPTPMLGRKVFVDPQEAGPAWTPSSVMRQTIYEQVEPKTERHLEIASSSAKKLGSTTASSYMPVMNGTKYMGLDPRNEPKIAYFRQELKPERLQPRIDHLADCVQPALETKKLEREKQEQRLTNPHQEGARELVNGTQEHVGVRASQSDLQTEKRRQERQTSSDQEVRARRDELPQERRRRDRRMERQSSSEEEAPPRKEELPQERRRERHERKLERQESSEQDRSEKRTGGEKRSTLADIVEQLQEREHSQAPAQVRERDPGPRLHNGLPERTPRPDRPRARDRPKPRRRPRPKDPSTPLGETRRSRSAPAQSTCSAPPAPPSHTVQQEGCMFRKQDVEIEKKSSNRTQEGSEFFFHTKDETDLKNWVQTITTAISEHEEIAKWAQTHTTTSSTDDGNSRKTMEERLLSVSSKKK